MNREKVEKRRAQQRERTRTREKYEHSGEGKKEGLETFSSSSYAFLFVARSMSIDFLFRDQGHSLLGWQDIDWLDELKR
jgi:hypothetical protein